MESKRGFFLARILYVKDFFAAKELDYSDLSLEAQSQWNDFNFNTFRVPIRFNYLGLSGLS